MEEKRDDVQVGRAGERGRDGGGEVRDGCKTSVGELVQLHLPDKSWIILYEVYK